jgi:hypothetical protein
MLRLILTCILVLLSQPILAWEARNIAFIPHKADGSPGAIGDWAHLGQDGSILGFDFEGAYGGASTALLALQKMATRDLRALERAGFRDPNLTGTFRDSITGLSYLPIYLVADDPGFNAPARAGCFQQWIDPIIDDPILVDAGRQANVVQLNAKPGAAFNLHRISSPTPGRFQTMINYQTSVLVHEFVHLFQQNGMNHTCNARSWTTEGMANAVSHYLMSKHRTRMFRSNRLYWDQRDYSIPLSLHTLPDKYESGEKSARKSGMEYRTGSFFRYLLEASEVSGTDGLKLARDITRKITPHEAKTDTDLVVTLDGLLRRHYGRGLPHILPEFLTEYASYGGRYRRNSWRSHETWIEDAFNDCIQVILDPFSSVKEVDVDVAVNAGECLDVRWSGFAQPVGLQFYAEGDKLDSLHLGEAVRSFPATGTPRGCYAATRNMPERIRRPMRQKCILKRGLFAADGVDVAVWNSDQPIGKSFGQGRAYYVFSAVDQDPRPKSGKRRYTVTIGATSVHVDDEIDEDAHQPPEQVENREYPIKGGRANLKQRVAAHHMGTDRHLVDGQSTFRNGEALGYMEGMRALADTGDDAAVVMIPLKGYTLFLVDVPGTRTASGRLDGAAGGGSEGEEDFRGVFVIARDTARNSPVMQALTRAGMPGMEAFAAMGALGTPIANGVEFTGSIEPVQTDEGTLEQRTVARCGTANHASVGRSDFAPGLEVSGSLDLFDFSKINAAVVDECSALEAAFDRRVSFRVFLPYRPQYVTRTIRRHRSSAQDVYDEQEFVDGPNLGGVATAHYYSAAIARGEPLDGENPDGSDTGSFGGAAEGCDCTNCPETGSLPSAQCLQVCMPRWARCGAEDAKPQKKSNFQKLLRQAQNAPRPQVSQPEPLDRYAIEAMIEEKLLAQPEAVRDLVREQLRRQYLGE